MTEDTYRKWDIASKAVVPILTVSGILVGLWQFRSDQRAQLDRQNGLVEKNPKVEFKRRMCERQTDVYTKLAEVVGRISSGRQTEETLRADIGQLRGLYWGMLIFVGDDDAVDDAANKYLVRADDLHDGLQTGADAISRLKESGVVLLKACRKSLKNNGCQEAD